MAISIENAMGETREGRLSMKTVAHCTALYLHTSGAWLHAQIARHRRYRPLVLAQDTANLEEFPVERLWSAARYPTIKRLVNRVVRKSTGQYPFYAGILKREEADLIHAHFGDQAFRCLRARKGSGLPMLTSFYGADATQYPRLPGWRERYGRLFAEGEGFLVEGRAMKKRLVELGCPVEKIHVHHLGVDVERISFVERRPIGRVRFLICAAFREKKGIPYALRALAQAREERPFSFELVLIGDGPDRPEIKKLVEDLGLSEQVDVRGMRPYSEVIGELGRCHALLQTSATAADGDGEGGAPVILLDAQASGMPVVGTYHADIPEYVVDGVSGFLAPERDVEGLADCILRLVGAPEKWTEMGREGRRHVEMNYSATTQGEELEGIYDEFTG